MARKFSKVERFVWRDKEFRKLSRLEKLLWHYLLTSPHYTSLPGLLPIPLEAVAKDMCEAFDEPFQKGFAKVVSLGWAEYDEDAVLIYLPKAISHNMPESPNVITGWSRHFHEIPESHLRDKWLMCFERVITEESGKREAFDKSFRKGFAKDLERLSKELGKPFRKTLPNPEPEPEPDPKPENSGDTRAPVDRNEYVGAQETDAQRIVALMVPLWPQWPQYQIEPSVMKLMAADPGIPLVEWEAIVREAHRTCPPKHPTYRLHTWVANQVSIHKRGKEASKGRQYKSADELRRERNKAAIDEVFGPQANPVPVGGTADFGEGE